MMMHIGTKLAARLFDAAVLTPLCWGHGRIGAGMWPPLEVGCRSVTRLAGRIASPLALLARGSTLGPAMMFVDLAEGIFGITGEWEIVDDATVIRRVPSCPFAAKLRDKNTTEFCTILGLALGEGFMAGFGPRGTLSFEIRSTISCGGACCEYVVKRR